jgi:lysozyme
MKISGCGILFVAEFEAFYPYTYDDARPKHPYVAGTPKVGTLTIGFGTTNPRYAFPGNTCTKEQAQGWFLAEIDTKYGAAVNRLNLPLSQQRYDALTSWAYNMGAGAFNERDAASMMKLLREPHRWGNLADVSSVFEKYRNPGTIFEGGLRRRRQREARIFALGDYGFPCDPGDTGPPPTGRRRREDDE